MRKSLVHLVLATFFLVLFSGCSDRTSGPISAPDTATPGIHNYQLSQSNVWGIYDITFDPATLKFNASTNRNSMFTLNIVKFLNNNPPCLKFKLNSSTPGSHVVDLDFDITIKHPMDDAKFDAYDVRGVLLGEDGISMAYNNDLTYTDPDSNQVLLNPDGYTRWYNGTEFLTPGIFGYTKGIYSPKAPFGTATLNAYKYFGEALGATDDLWTYLSTKSLNVGYFLHSSSNTRNYKIRFHYPENGIKFGYSILASWSGASPEYHPSHAPETVAVSVVDQSDLYYKSPTDTGGSLILDISVFDWFSELDGDVMKDYNILLESPVHTSFYKLSDSEMTPVESGLHWNKYHVEIPGNNINQPGETNTWIIIEYPNSDYSNPFGVLNAADGDPLVAIFRLRPIIKDLSEESGWAVTYGGQYRDWYEGMAFDSQSNIYVTGIVGTIASPNAHEYLILNKHDSKGNLIWERSWGNPDTYSDAAQIAVDSAGNTYSAGFFSGENVDFDPGPGEDLHSSTYPDGFDIFLTSFDSEGNFRWARTWGGLNDLDIAFGVALDDAGFVYVVGEFNSDTVDFDPGSGTDIHTNSGGFDSYLTKFDISGNFQWAVSWGGEQSVAAFGVTVDSSGNTVVSGFFQGSADFDPGSGSDIHSTDWIDAYVSKFAPDGSFVYAKSWGAAGGAQAMGIASDSLDNFYVIGDFLGTGVDFDPGAGTDLHDSLSASVADAFMSKFNSSGDFLWARTWGGTDEVWGDHADYVAVKGLEAVYVTGDFYGPDVDFDPGPGVDLQSSDGTNCFLTRFDTDGNWYWTRVWPTASLTYPYGLGVSPTGSICVSGNFDGTNSEFAPVGSPCNAPSTIFSTPVNNESDGFIIKFMPDGCW